MALSSDLTGSTGSEAGEEENERNQREEEEEEEEEDKGPAPHLLLQLTLGKELAKSNRWELLTYPYGDTNIDRRGVLQPVLRPALSHLFGPYLGFTVLHPILIIKTT